MARPLKIFMRGKSITALQATLRRMGYDIQDQAALFGTSTRDAVKSFQRQQGLKPTGIVDDALLKQMNAGQQVTAPTQEHEQDTTPPANLSNGNQEQFDALLRLLKRKGILEDGELEKEVSKLMPSSL
ncbi:MAG: peptidoglycan-binding domain-containing protein [Ghiorsea sp.]